MTTAKNTKPSSKSTKKPLTESQIQKKYIKWCRASDDPRLRWVHSTQTAGARTIQARMRAKQEGMLAGIADVSLPYPCGQYHGFYLEFKNPRARKASFNKPDQLEFQQHCDKYNYQYHMVTDAEEAIKLTQDYLALES